MKYYNPLLILILLFVSHTLGAEQFNDIPRPEIIAKQVQTENGSAIQMMVTLKRDWHITSHNPTDEFAFGAEVEFKNPQFQKGKVIWPEPIVKFIESIGVKNSFYEGSFEILIPLKESPDKVQGQEVVLHYQSCTQQLCLAPDFISTIIW